MIEQILNYITGIRDLAVNTYGVDPVIFIVLYVLTIPVYYYGVALMIRGLTQHKKTKKSLNKNKVFMWGLTVNFIGWVVPYVYVLLAGKNIPAYFYLMLMIYIIVFFYLGVKKHHTRILYPNRASIT